MRVVLIGGTGHIGSYLVPRLVRRGHDVVSLSRGSRRPYVEDPAWEVVEQVTVDREDRDAEGTFAGLVKDLEPEVVIDLLCFTLDSAVALVEGLRGHIDHLVHCGSVWIHGPSLRAPILESNESAPFGQYGIEKARIASMLSHETASGGMVTTSLHPGHISGPGWAVINAVGNTDHTVWERLAAGQVLDIPGLGAEMMAHVHADDVAQAFSLAVEHRDAAAGESFHVAAASALTVRGLAELAAGWFGQAVELRSVSWEEFGAATTAEFAEASWDHLIRSHHVSIAKAERLLGYRPAYAPEEAVKEAVRWLVDHGRIATTSSMHD
ncbi:NAD-dependent epimerase/dehydratase family protein [Nocardioides immobilis]|uniref:NAD-dependent epimerase/dehydratase family protein n=1 Tax=Nocardioides immobilis TaxID=2049295 RepID=A0A417XTI4_9ACTN|nr:NAD-dependent epimerase/dehydratase family protein [Nocardioides immobilis]RHW23762.1 NAD-dependent epimerase/dehydratase family protein [Nocardioides immobilis]